MPRIIHVVESNYTPSFRAAKVAGMFDVPITEKLSKRWDINIPIHEHPWQIGLITGASGSGKTTIAKQLFPDKMHSGFEWKAPCLLDDFPASADVSKITEVLSRVGFSSPPSWLLPYHVLSNGQKFRVELARCLFEYDDLFVFDEFTSVVDRQVAQIGAHAFQKAIRHTKKQFVAVSCHFDIEEWLQPDWVLDISTQQFKWGSLRRPNIEVEIYRTLYTTWEIFKEHHYLNADINKAAFCFTAFINGRPVAFSAWLPFFGKLSHGKAMRAHRTVVSPDFQGLGIGGHLVNTIASAWAGLGWRVFSSTAHPANIRQRLKGKEWILKRQGRTGADSNPTFKHATNRFTASFEYVGTRMEQAEASQLLNLKPINNTSDGKL